MLATERNQAPFCPSGCDSLGRLAVNTSYMAVDRARLSKHIRTAGWVSGGTEVKKEFPVPKPRDTMRLENNIIGKELPLQEIYLARL
jgi:hypothetical protein